jgi:hypothetical protein
VNNGVRRIFFPERIAFIWVIGHRHYLVAFNVMPLRVPDKFSRRRKRKVPNVIAFENPGFFARRFTCFVCFGFFIGNDFHRLSGCFGLF